MRSTLRTFFFSLLAIGGLTAMAQNSITLMGSVIPCSGVSYPVWIFSDPGTVPMVDTVINTNANCDFLFTFHPTTSTGGIAVLTSCDGGLTWGEEDSLIYSASPFDTLMVNLNCAGGATNSVTLMGAVSPCSGASYPVHIISDPFTVPAVDTIINTDMDCTYLFTFYPTTTDGLMLVQASCDGGQTFGESDTASYATSSDTLVVNLSCGAGPSVCQAAFTVQQAVDSNSTLIPWQITTTNTSTGTGSMSYQWTLMGGIASTSAEPTFTLSEPGAYNICLTLNTSDGCYDVVCDTLLVDSSGFISTIPSWYDCFNAPNGPNVPGTACVGIQGGTNFTGTWDNNCVCQPDNLVDCLGIPNGPNAPGTFCTDSSGNAGTWSTDCDCVVGTFPGFCTSDYWVIQAYDSTAAGVEPIPNEVWVWNLSTGTGDFQFVWDFGDGTTSTEAYPTHVYSGPGPWQLCLSMVSDSCIDVHCDSLSMDANGILNQLVIDGGGVVGHESGSGSRSGGFTLNVIQQIPTGISESPAFAELKAWPNPVLNELNLSINTSVSGTVPVTVIDPSGRTVIAASQHLTSGSNTFRISTSTLEPGLYMVRIGNDARSITQRFMKVQ